MPTRDNKGIIGLFSFIDLLSGHRSEARIFGLLAIRPFFASIYIIPYCQIMIAIAGRAWPHNQTDSFNGNHLL